MKKIRVIVLMGGRSPEHEISLISGREVVNNLNKKKYEALPVVISKDGKNWKLTDKKSLDLMSNPIALRGTGKDMVLANKKSISGINSFSDGNKTVVFIAMAGPYGEDGTMQGLLELSGIPYTGSGVLASALGMDKIKFRDVMKANSIPVPNEGKGFPMFVKPSGQGSSVGASIVKNKKDLKNALKLAKKFGGEPLIEEYIKGTEVTCAVLGNKKPYTLPVIEIVPLKGEFFDYESKYTESGAEEIIPARISKSLTKKVQELAIKVYKVLGCKGFARVDFILKADGSPIVLEINTIPGLTPMSLLPKAARAAGISYSNLLDRIIKYAI
jgi:D-alanine-D-alanine ligase